MITFSRFGVHRRNYIKIALLVICVKDFFEVFLKIVLTSVSSNANIYFALPETVAQNRMKCGMYLDRKTAMQP